MIVDTEKIRFVAKVVDKNNIRSLADYGRFRRGIAFELSELQHNYPTLETEEIWLGSAYIIRPDGSEDYFGQDPNHFEKSWLMRGLNSREDYQEAMRLLYRIDDLRERLKLLSQELTKRLGKLPENQAKILHLRYVDGLPWDMVAKKAHYSPRMVYKLHRRALDKMAGKEPAPKRRGRPPGSKKRVKAAVTVNINHADQVNIAGGEDE